MGFDNWLMSLDKAVVDLFSKWDVSSTALLAIIITYFAWSVFTTRDPDAHPMLLARQAQASPVRKEGESAIFRSHSSPHGIPLNSGLNIKDAGDSKWSRGRDGDLRDIWRKVISGVQDREGKDSGDFGKIFTVLGSEHVIEHKLADVTRQINLIGQQIKQNGGKNVAIYLPNSIEFLIALFACAFYELTAILVPYDQEQSVEEIISLLKQSNADTVIAAAGSIPFDAITQSYSALKQLVWVVDEGSAHMDWDEIPKGTGGPVNISTWQEILQDQDALAGFELPAVERTNTTHSVLASWPSGELVEYTQANLIAGIAGQLNSIPTTQRIAHSDLFVPVDSLSTIYPLILTLGALFSNASVALNSVAGQTPDIGLATKGVAPTIIVAKADTLLHTHTETTRRMNSSLYRFVHWLQTRTLVQEGVMPLASVFSRMFDRLRPSIGTTPGKLRLIYVSEQAGAKSIPLSSQVLSDLRIYTSSRIIYALTAAKVAGAVAQTGLYDYRVGNDPEKYSHFGAPVTSVEIFFRDTKEHQTTDEQAAGQIFASGPSVVGGEASLDVHGKINEDYTLSLL